MKKTTNKVVIVSALHQNKLHETLKFDAFSLIFLT